MALPSGDHFQGAKGKGHGRTTRWVAAAPARLEQRGVCGEMLNPQNRVSS